MGRPAVKRALPHSRRFVFHFAAILVGLLAVLPRIEPLFMDEAFVLRGGAHLLQNRTLNPPWHEWPPLIAYLSVPCIAAAAFAGSLWTGLPPRDWAALAAGFHDVSLLWPLRAISTTCLVLTSYLIFRSMVRLGLGIRVPLVVSVAGCVGCAHVLQYACWGLPDVPMLAAGAGALALTLAPHHRWREDRSKRFSSAWRPVVCGGLVGLATALKFHGALFGLSALALLLTGRTRQPAAIIVARFLAGSLAGFILFAPTFVLHPTDAWGGIAWLFGNLGKDRYAPNDGQFTPVPPPIKDSILEFFGLPLLCFLGALLPLMLPARWTNSRQNQFSAKFYGALLATPLVNLLLVCLSQRRDANYLIPCLPGFLIAYAAMIGRFQGKCRKWIGSRTVVGFILVTAVLFPLSQAISLPSYDTRESMAAFLREVLPPGAVVLRVGGYTPKVWSPAEIEEFRQGPGRHLGPAGQIQFETRLAERPQAAITLHLPERSTTPTEVLRRLEPGTWIIATSILEDRTRLYPKDDGGWGQFFHELRHSGRYDSRFQITTSRMWPLRPPGQSAFVIVDKQDGGD